MQVNRVNDYVTNAFAHRITVMIDERELTDETLSLASHHHIHFVDKEKKLKKCRQMKSRRELFDRLIMMLTLKTSWNRRG